MDETRHSPPMRETTDVDAWAVGKFGIALALLCVVSLVLLWGMFRYFEKLHGAPEKGATNPVKVFPQPQLQQTPVLDLRAIREAEETTLTTYGWVDQQKGVVRIPIDRAIDLLAARGLPARKT